MTPTITAPANVTCKVRLSNPISGVRDHRIYSLGVPLDENHPDGNPIKNFAFKKLLSYQEKNCGEAEELKGYSRPPKGDMGLRTRIDHIRFQFLESLESGEILESRLLFCDVK